MKKSNPIFIIFFCILFTVVTVGSAHALPTPSNISKFARCASAKGATFSPIKNTSKGTGEKCCYPRNKTTGLKTCIKCVYPSGGGTPICTKNQFSVSDKFKSPIISGGASSPLAPPKPLTQAEKLKRGRFNPGNTPGKLAPPTAPTTTPGERARRPIMERNPGQRSSNSVVENPPTVKVPQSRFTPYDVAPSRKELSNRRNFRFNRPTISNPAWNAYQRCLAKQKRGMKIRCNKP